MSASLGNLHPMFFASVRHATGSGMSLFPVLTASSLKGTCGGVHVEPISRNLDKAMHRYSPRGAMMCSSVRVKSHAPSDRMLAPGMAGASSRVGRVSRRTVSSRRFPALIVATRHSNHVSRDASFDGQSIPVDFLETRTDANPIDITPPVHLSLGKVSVVRHYLMQTSVTCHPTGRFICSHTSRS